MQKTIVTVIITALIIGGGVYLLQNKPDALPQEIQNTECTAPPSTTAIGSEVYPINPKYEGLEFLGQLFTAYNCSTQRLSKIWGVDGDNYTLGLTIWLNDEPSQSLIDIFKSIGFYCAEESCKKWEILETVKIDDLMKLEPYYKTFKMDDCRHCG